MTKSEFRNALVKYNGLLAGHLSETENGYKFVYEASYLEKGQAISLSLPLQKGPYESKDLFPFFEGLLPEGWYLHIVSATAKIDPRDAFGLLLATTSNTIGAVTVHKT
ncbi:MAG: HipA N-terminal domain-containing protein [Candidatus Omnitrophica bacterium]|nr:HipA N-terminal domain-containing protein [Candidatus Omnitrophota bacterium]